MLDNFKKYKFFIASLLKKLVCFFSDIGVESSF